MNYELELFWTMLVINAHSADSLPNHNLHIKVMVLMWCSIFFIFRQFLRGRAVMTEECGMAM